MDVGCCVCVRDKYVEIWVPRKTPESVVANYVMRCRSQGLPIVIYRSGNGNLTELTCTLLGAQNSHLSTK